MKKIIFVSLLFIFVLTFSSTIYGKESVWQQNQEISFSGGKRMVNAIYVDLNDKTIRM